MGKGIMAGAGIAYPSALNALSSDVLDGFSFVGSSKKKASGTISSKSTETFTPGISSQTINGGLYLSGPQIIRGDPNLIPANILEGVTIFGVTGTYRPPLSLRLASDNINAIWCNPGDDIYDYVSDGIRFNPRTESSGEDIRYDDLPAFDAYVAFKNLIDFSKYSRVTVSGYRSNYDSPSLRQPCFASIYTDFIGPEISYDYTNWRFITHQQTASADGFSASFDISSENSTGYLLMVFNFRDLSGHIVYEWPSRTYTLTSVVLTQ